MDRVIHFLYVPWTGLGLYNGFRGNRWLRNRIKVFKQFVLPSILGQTNLDQTLSQKDFVLWMSWRPEERSNYYVKQFVNEMSLLPNLTVINTYGGVCFWDDKYPDQIARTRLMDSLHSTLGEMINFTGDKEYDSVLMTIQPSDDCYHKNAMKAIKLGFQENSQLQAIGFTKGYVMNYLTGEVAEYNPTTNPPFFTIKFPRNVFIDPTKHVAFTGPYKSHEYIGEKLKYGKINERGFLVGTHFDNISTVFDHPYKGETVPQETLKEFNLENAGKLVIPNSLRRKFFHALPYQVKRKLRFWSEQKSTVGWVVALVYNSLRA